jgi:hypothetical protein
MAHGSGLVVLMTWSLLGYHIVRLAGSRLDWLPTEGRFGLLPHVSFIAAALGTLFFTEHFMWLGFAAGVPAVALYARGSPAGRPAGLAISGLLVSTLSIAYWLYLKWIFSTAS